MIQPISQNSDRNILNEVVVSLHMVDNKIASLHDCSTEDFQTFNNYLKKYHKVAEKVSQNSKEIGRILSDNESISPLKELEQIHEILQTHIARLHENINNSVDKLSEIQDNLNRSFLPLKNLNQDFLTMKFLNSNFSFFINYRKGNYSNHISNLSENINLLTNDVRYLFSIVDNSVFQLKIIIKNTFSDLSSLQRENQTKFFLLSNQIQDSIKILSEKSKSANENLELLAEKSNVYTERINNIITNLQYHDIIRQKMEHIQEAQRDLVNQINNLEDKEVETDLQKCDNCVEKVRDITGLQIIQLIHTNKQYQSAIEIISQKFIEICEDLDHLSHISHNFLFQNIKPDETRFFYIEDKLEKALEFDYQLRESIDVYHHRMKNIKMSIEKLTISYKRISGLRNLLTKIHTTCNHLSTVPQSGVEGTVEQINLLATNLLSILDVLDKNFENIYNVSKELITENSKLETKVADDLPDLSDRIHNIAQTLKQKNNLISRIIKTNSDEIHSITTEIKASIDQVKYYDFFERIIEEIILGLNQVYTRLIMDSTLSTTDKQTNLKIIEDRYTMNSERAMHNNYVNNGDQKYPQIVEANDVNSEEDSIEFF